MVISQSPISSPDDTPWGYVKLLKGHTSEGMEHYWQVVLMMAKQEYGVEMSRHQVFNPSFMGWWVNAQSLDEDSRPRHVFFPGNKSAIDPNILLRYDMLG
ncbi:hypothetical protein JHK82_047966 [Glycine max]|nr:hypothetical protein JHK82_047966 [Glycine max]